MSECTATPKDALLKNYEGFKFVSSKPKEEAVVSPKEEAEEQSEEYVKTAPCSPVASPIPSPKKRKREEKEEEEEAPLIKEMKKTNEQPVPEKLIIDSKKEFREYYSESLSTSSHRKKFYN